MNHKLSILALSISLSLTACGGGSDNTKTSTATNDTPISNVSVVTNKPKVGELTEVSASDSYDPNNDNLAYFWEVTSPSGNKVTLPSNTKINLSFVPAEQGVYVVKLTVTDAKGAASNKTINLTVDQEMAEGNQSPLAVIDVEQEQETVYPFDIVVFKGNKSSDPEGASLTYKWEVIIAPNEANFAFSDPTEINTQFAAETLGEYTIQLTVSDGKTSHSTSKILKISDGFAALDAKISMLSEVKRGSTVSVSSEESVFTENTSITWSFKSKPLDSQAKFEDEKALNTQFIPDIAGEYSIELMLESDGIISSTTKMLIATSDVSNIGPEAKITSANSYVSLSNKLALSAESSNDADSSRLTYLWEIISSPDDAMTMTLTNPNSKTTEFSANVTGYYTVKLTVSDGEHSSSDTLKITVLTRNQVPNVAINVNDPSLRHGETAVLYGVVGDDSKDLTYKWILISKPTNSATMLSDTDTVSTSLYLDQPGKYIVGFTASDWEHTSVQALKEITAGNNLHPVITAVDYPTTVKVKTETQVTAQGTDPEGMAITYEWSVTDKPAESTLVLPVTSANQINFTPDVKGWYTLAVSANDGIQSSLLPMQFVIVVTD